MPELPDIFAIFPELKKSGRTSLFVHEMAVALGCTSQHVLNLIEVGKIKALNIASTDARAAIRIPIGEYARFLGASFYDPLAAAEPQKTENLKTEKLTSGSAVKPRQGELF